MKKVLRYLLMTVLALCFTVPCLSAAEAATVALLPLINHVEGDELANKVYYNNAIKALKSQPGFVVIENNKLNQAIDDSKYAETGMEQAVLAKIAKEGDVDIVFVMQLDKLAKKPMHRVGERMVKLDLLGKAAAYNRLNGVYYTHVVRGDKEIDETLTSRWDWTHEEFGRAVRVEINRALRAK